MTNGAVAGEVFSFDADLNLLWSDTLANVGNSGPALGPDGTMIVTATGTDVRAYQTETRLTLNAPDPGTAGVSNVLAVRGATPGAAIAMVYSPILGNTPVPGCPGVFVGLASIQLAGTDVADTEGKASVSYTVPPIAARRTVYHQAVEPGSCQVTPLIEFFVQ